MAASKTVQIIAGQVGDDNPAALLDSFNKLIAQHNKSTVDGDKIEQIASVESELNPNQVALILQPQKKRSTLSLGGGKRKTSVMQKSSNTPTVKRSNNAQALGGDAIVLNDDEGSGSDTPINKPGVVVLPEAKKIVAKKTRKLNKAHKQDAVDSDIGAKEEEIKQDSDKNPDIAGDEIEKPEQEDSSAVAAVAPRGVEKRAKPSNKIEVAKGLKIKIKDNMTLEDLANAMQLKAIDLAMNWGIMQINQVVDKDTAAMIVEGMENIPVIVEDKDAKLERDVEDIVYDYAGEPSLRPPVVTVMGHVDHGKTSLLDYIRSASVAEGESGGITQHVGAYSVKVKDSRVTFLDTPGHEAFTAMRSRGAKTTDIVILVVAGDDGIKPQTLEAIEHAKAADVPIVVVVNKVDRPAFDADKVKTELANYEVVTEEWGGDAVFHNVSAKVGTGIDDLLESLLLQAEVMELKAYHQGPATGTVIESRLDKGCGPVATLLIQQGELKVGDSIIAGTHCGRVRLMRNEDGEVVRQAGPSDPVVVLGLSGVPNAGENFAWVKNEKKGREIANVRYDKKRNEELIRQRAEKFGDMLTRISDSNVEKVNLIIKADANGSAEAIKAAVEKLSTPELRVNVIYSKVGGVNASDVQLALASDALLVAFNVRPDAIARKLIDKEGVSVGYFSIIYDLIDYIKLSLEGMMAPIEKEEIIGTADVREVFRSSRWGSVAGCKVIEGYIRRHAKIRVIRDQVVIYDGEVSSLREFKDDVKEVKQGKECGIGVEGYNDIKAGDQLESYLVQQVEK